MKYLFNNEDSFKKQMDIFRNDKSYDSYFIGDVPTSYPCIGLYLEDRYHEGDKYIELVDFIYPSDFNA